MCSTRCDWAFSLAWMTNLIIVIQILDHSICHMMRWSCYFPERQYVWPIFHDPASRICVILLVLSYTWIHLFTNHTWLLADALIGMHERVSTQVLSLSSLYALNTSLRHSKGSSLIFIGSNVVSLKLCSQMPIINTFIKHFELQF